MLTTKSAKQMLLDRGQALPRVGYESIVTEFKQPCGCFDRVWLVNCAGKYSTRVDFHACDACWFKLPIR